MVAINSGVLLTENVLAINFAGLLTLWYLGYRPQSWIRVPQTRTALLKRGATLFVALLVTTAFVWNASYASVQRSQFEENLEQNVDDLLDAPEYDQVTLVDVKVDHDRTELLGGPEKVIVTVGYPPEGDYPSLQEAITGRVEQRTGEGIAVEVHVSRIVTERERS